ncbi:hypothetical protein VSDG_06947 [Cytospora chrysosperma]|uniref:Uncharacterized protein n=1 Tax=Cytospora chrysosperma TaxID=252740 RepID=A0A423VRU3_CYTCH|nr:hypothetical protein VSDG_06947 [Valsa sordida]
MASKPEESDAAKAEPKAQEQNLEDMTDVPDPDEDDLDDLDGMDRLKFSDDEASDMLDDFSAVKIDPKKTQVADAGGPGRPSASAQETEAKAEAEDDALLDDDFAKQLQAGMAELMGEMDDSFENIFKELGAAAAATGEAPPSASAPAAEAPKDAKASSPPTGPDASFQETIRRTMERMQASGEQATAAAQSEGSDDFMAELLKQMQAGGMEGGLEGSEEEFSKLLMGMMEQLTNKDILYEPMKELNDKFPDWMAKNKDKISEENRKNYEVQEVLAREIVAKFEESTYSDSNTADREYIVDRMQKGLELLELGQLLLLERVHHHLVRAGGRLWCLVSPRSMRPRHGLLPKTRRLLDVPLEYYPVEVGVLRLLQVLVEGEPLQLEQLDKTQRDRPNSFLLPSWATSRFWVTGFGRAGRDANLLSVCLAGPADADMGDDWVALRALASRGASGGGVVARMGLDDKGEETAGR